MENITAIFNMLTSTALALTWQQAIMIIVGGGLIYLAIKKEYEPTLLLPIGFGAIIMNIPHSSAHEALEFFFNTGILTEVFPLLIFVAVGAMIDFSPLLRNPKLMLFGAAAQFGIFFTIAFALLVGFDIKEAASIGIIGAADGPTSIYVATKFAKHLLGPISVAAYSYMALVPIIQPPVIKALTSLKERKIRMDSIDNKPVPKIILILFPIFVTVIAGFIAPISVALIGFLMFGNLVRECGVLNKLSLAAQNELASLVTLLLGITIAFTMTGERFIQVETLLIIGMGLVAFIMDTAGGVIFAKLLNLLPIKHKFNPMIGAAGISAFPMSSRVIHAMGREADPHNYLLMHAVSANVAGQIGSVIAGGVILALVK